MKPIRHMLTISAALGVLSCAGDGPAGPDFPGLDGMTRIYLTDAPFPYDQVERVDVFIVSIAATTEADTGSGVDESAWVTVATPERRFNLLDLQDGTVALLGETELSAGTYQAVRVVIDASQSSMTSVDGDAIPIDWNDPQGTGATHVAVYALVEGALDVPAEGANIVLDFDVGRSFLDHGAGPGYLFVPWIRAVNEATTGSISGVVRGSDAPLESIVPVPNASITVYDRNSCGPLDFCIGIVAPVASGRTDAQGRYTVHFIPAGRYMVVAAPPEDFNAGLGVRDTVAVAAGETSAADIYLAQSDGNGEGGTGVRIEIGGDRSVEVGDSIYFNAVVFSEHGDSVLNQDVTWTSTNPQVASIVGSDGGAVVVRGLALGTSSIIARSGELADTATVTVIEHVEPGPVATVEVFPQSVSIAIGDTLFVGAILRDAEGREITNRSVTWTVTPSGILRTDQSAARSIFFTAVGAGTATVRAAIEEKSGQTVVTVGN